MDFLNLLTRNGSIYRIQHIVFGLIFVGLASTLVFFEYSTPNPFHTGYWNGIIAAFNGFALLMLAAKPSSNMLICASFCGGFTIVGCVTAALSSMGPNQGKSYRTQISSVAVLTGSTYCLVILLMQQGFCTNNEGYQDHDLPILTITGVINSSPPPDFILPTEVPCLPDYDNLSDPPSYHEATAGTKVQHTNSE